jgi:hypothetical protein
LAVAGHWSNRGWVRALIACVVAVALIAPVAAIAGWHVFTATSDLRTVGAQRRGVEYLRPLTTLLGALVAGRSAAVRGDPVDADAIRAAIADVERAEAANGAALETQQRWSDVRTRVGQLTGSKDVGLVAYQRWSEAVELTRALGGRIAETSDLFVGPQLDTHYLLDAGLLRIPEVISGAGDLADLSAFAAGKSTPADEVRIAVTRARVVAAAAAVNGGLAKANDATQGRRLSTALLQPLDQFGAATDALAPPVDVLAMPPLPANVPAAAVGARVAAVRLAAAVFTELDALIAARQRDLDLRRRQVLGVAAAGVLVAVVVAVAIGRRRRPVFIAPTAATAHPARAAVGVR